MKIDISDGFYRVNLNIDDIPKLGAAYSAAPGKKQLIAFPLVVLPMGWNNSPSAFCTVTETIADTTNQAIKSNVRPSWHSLDDLAQKIQTRAATGALPGTTGGIPGAVGGTFKHIGRSRAVQTGAAIGVIPGTTGGIIGAVLIGAATGGILGAVGGTPKHIGRSRAVQTRTATGAIPGTTGGILDAVLTGAVTGGILGAAGGTPRHIGRNRAVAPPPPAANLVVSGPSSFRVSSEIKSIVPPPTHGDVSAVSIPTSHDPCLPQVRRPLDELLKQCKLLLLIYFNYLIYGYLIVFSSVGINVYDAP